MGGLKERKAKAQVHGNAAKLKGKIPPVVLTAIFNVEQKALLVKLHEGQKKPAGKQDPGKVFFLFCRMDRQNAGDPGTRDGQEKMKSRPWSGRHHWPGCQLKETFHRCLLIP